MSFRKQEHKVLEQPSEIIVPNITCKINHGYKAYSCVRQSNDNKIDGSLGNSFNFGVSSIHNNTSLIVENNSRINLQQCIHRSINHNAKQSWKLYCQKSALLKDVQIWHELQQYLLKTIHKLLAVKLESNNASVNNNTPNQANNSIVQGYGNKDNEAIKATQMDPKIKKITEQLNRKQLLLSQCYEQIEKYQFQLQNNVQRIQCMQDQQMNDQQNKMMQITAVYDKKNHYHQQMEIYQRKNNILLYQSAMMHSELQSALRENGQYLQKIQKLQKEINWVRKEQQVMYRQLWLMQHEQLRFSLMNQQKLKEQNSKLSAKIVHLKQKNKHLLNSFNFNTMVNVQQQQEKQELDVVIKSFQQWLKIISVPKVIKYGDNYNVFIDQVVNSQTSSKQNISTYKFNKPNFYIFYQAYQSVILLQKNGHSIRPLENDFFLKIRAIFDAMWNHFETYSHYKQWIAFPEFVIGILQRYKLNSETHTLELCLKPVSNESKVTFLMNIFNKKLANTWQCDIFRRFLQQKHTLDEIYFFLYCRNQVYNGLALSKNIGTTDPISFIKVDQILQIVKNVLNPYDSHIIHKVHNIIISRKKQKYGIEFVDRYFVLKILLQVYCLEKQKSLKFFNSQMQVKIRKQCISYGDFQIFMSKNFPFLNFCEIAQLYRQTYFLSQTKITAQAIHQICCQKGLFIPLLLNKKLSTIELTSSLEGDMLLLDIHNQVTKISNQIQSYGSQKTINFEMQINHLLRSIHWYRNNPSIFFNQILQLRKIILENCYILNKHVRSYKNYDILTTSQIKDTLTMIRNELHYCDKPLAFLKQRKEQRKQAQLMLIRNFKISIKQSLKQFNITNKQNMKKQFQKIQKEAIKQKNQSKLQ